MGSRSPGRGALTGMAFIPGRLSGRLVDDVPVDAVALPAEQRDRLAVLVADLDVVDARASGPAALDACRVQYLPGVRGRQVIDRAALRDRVAVVAVAGKRKGAVGEQENVTAMADRVPVHHVVAHGHRHLCMPRPD